MKKTKKKILTAVASVILLLLAEGGIYIANGLLHKSDVIMQVLKETAQEDTDEIFDKTKNNFNVQGIELGCCCLTGIFC